MNIMDKRKTKKRIDMRSLTEEQRWKRLIIDIQEAKYKEEKFDKFMNELRKLALKHLSRDLEQTK